MKKSKKLINKRFRESIGRIGRIVRIVRKMLASFLKALQRNMTLWLTHTILSYVRDLRKEYEIIQERYKSGRQMPEIMSDEEMVTVLQTRNNNNMGLIATHPQTSMEQAAAAQQPQGDREQEIDLTDEEWEEIDRAEAEGIAEYERHIRDAVENPEPNNLEEE